MERQVKILFFGETERSAIIKRALIVAGYPVVFSYSDRAIKILPELIISADFGEKISREQLGTARYGGLNLHPSLLPAYRGATPVPHQILDGLTVSGITIIKMSGEFDAGPIVAQEKVKILPDDTTPDLLKRCFTAGAKLLVKILPDYLNNKITLKPQPLKSPTPYCRRFTKQDGFIPWPEVARNLKIENWEFKIERATRALHPWPGIWTTLPTGKTLKLLPKNMYQLEGKQPITRKQFEAGYSHLL